MGRSYSLPTWPGSVNTLAGPTVAGGRNITIKNVHASEVIYLGGDENVNDLSATTGFPLAAGATVQIQLTGTEVLYGLSGNATVTNTVRIFSTNFQGR